MNVYLLYLNEGVILLFNNLNTINFKPKKYTGAEEGGGCLKTGSHAVTAVVNIESWGRGSRKPTQDSRRRFKAEAWASH